MGFYDNKIALRLGGENFGKETEIYKFEKIKRAKQEAKKLHPDLELIDMGVGEPDEAADSGVVEELSKQAGKLENRWYADNGIPEFQEAAAKYLSKVYGVNNIDPYTNIIHGIGTKPILAMLPLCLINPGDVALMTTPGYPVLGTYTKYLGGEVFNLPLTKENNFYPELDGIPKDILNRAKVLYINYPNNPTGQVANKEFFQKVIQFAYKNDVVIIHDAAYSAITFDGYKPLSFLSVDGAMEVGVEIHSLSKSFNMTGWRMGFIVGQEKIIKAYGTIKDNTDSGQFRAIQKAGIFALNNTNITDRISQKYSRRFNLLVEALKEIGFKAVKPKGSFYCYVEIPKGTKDGVKFQKAEEVSEYLIKNALISTVPWDDAGAFLRFSVTFEAKDEKDELEIIREMKNRLLRLELEF